MRCPAKGLCQGDASTCGFPDCVGRSYTAMIRYRLRHMRGSLALQWWGMKRLGATLLLACKMSIRLLLMRGKPRDSK